MREDVRIPATDGYPLAATLHRPRDAPRALVLVASANGVPRGYYDAFAAHLADHGWLAATLDYRGLGGSRPASLRGFPARLEDWGSKDLAGFFAWAMKEHPDAPLLLVGHSVGAQLLGLAEGAPRLAGVVAVAATRPHASLYPFPTSLRRRLDWHVLIPLVAHACGRLPKWALGEELPRDVALQWARWGRSPDYVLRDGGPQRREAYARLRWPLLNIGLGDDPMAPPRAVAGLEDLYPNARVERRIVGPADVGGRAIGHFGFFRPRFEDTLWAQTREWLAARIARA